MSTPKENKERKLPSAKFRATWEIQSDCTELDLNEFHVSAGVDKDGSDEQREGYFPTDLDAQLVIYRGEKTWFVEMTVPTRGLETEDGYWLSANQVFGLFDGAAELI